MSAALRVIEPLVDLPAMATPATEPGLAVQLDRVVKRFGEREVLEGIDLDIPAGRLVPIVGRSGGGRSWRLRLLSEVETQASGRILLDLQPFAGLPLGVRML